VLIVETEQGRGIMGVIDGFKPQGIESKEDGASRKKVLRKGSYKL